MGPAVIERPRSALTHNGASAVFELAAKEPVRIKGRNEPDEVLLNAEHYEAWGRLLQRLYLVTRALQKGAAQMPDVEGLHWTKLFDVHERHEMLAELIEAVRASFERNEPSIFNATWKGWEHSAETLSDPDLVKRLTAPIDLGGTIKLPRP